MAPAAGAAGLTALSSLSGLGKDVLSGLGVLAYGLAAASERLGHPIQHFLSQPIYKETKRTKTHEEVVQIPTGLVLGAGLLLLLWRGTQEYHKQIKEQGKPSAPWWAWVTSPIAAALYGLL